MSANSPAVAEFRHEALLYHGQDDFVERMSPLLRGAVEAKEPVLVAIDPDKSTLLQSSLGSAAQGISWVDIRGIGRNPARIIPVWRHFVGRHQGGRRLLGVGEPIWSGRDPDALREAQRHEELLNLAFAHAAGFTLLCPYDEGLLDATVVDEASRSHAVIAGSGGPESSAVYPGLEALVPSGDEKLSEPPTDAIQVALCGADYAGIHAALIGPARAAGLGDAGAEHAALAVSALVAHMRDGDAEVMVRGWPDPDSLHVDVGGLAPATDPLAGREWPAPPRGPGRGLWLANQLCDLVQVRCWSGRTTVRLQLCAPGC